MFKARQNDTRDEKKPARPPRRSEARSGEVPRKGTRSQNALIRYFQETGDELRKVAWPSRETALRMTLIVLGSTVAAALFLGALDILFQRLAALLVSAS